MGRPATRRPDYLGIGEDRCHWTMVSQPELADMTDAWVLTDTIVL
jgi:hypothetical protein